MMGRDKMKVLNHYAGIGGNRKLWNEVDCTAIEINPEIAKIYKDFFPKDKIIVGDAHEYLLKHYNDGWDFIWSSPPCPSHSRINTDGRHEGRYPDMNLYQEIVFLGNNWFKGKWLVENVIPYYKPLIRPTNIIDRHCFWSNFYIPFNNFKPEKPIANQTGTNGRYGFNLKGVDIGNKRQILRNIVNPEIARFIFNCAFKLTQNHLVEG